MASTIFKSEKESDRFQMNIVRASMDELDVDALAKSIDAFQADLTILRIPCENVSQIAMLQSLPYAFFQTDTLVYYYVDFDVYTPKALKNADLSFVEAIPADKEILAHLVDEIFPGYTNHYNSNPHINKQHILEGYKEWVLDFVGAENKFVFLVKKNDAVVGFATCTKDGDEAEGVLYGVLPNAAGGGVYSDIIRFTQQYMKDLGVNTMKVSTQVQNYAVQKVWSREGFYMKKSFATLHINSLLGQAKKMD
jgi:hypothetical protein